MARRVRRTISYVLDWLAVIILAAGGGVLNWITGFHRPFTLTDPSFAYPYKPDIVPLALAGALSIGVPLAAILGLNGAAWLLELRQPQTSQGNRQRAILWEAHAGCLGLGLALASTLFVTSGLKDMVGKPRPDLYGRCDPDLDNLEKFIVGGFGTTLGAEATPLVTSAICRQTDLAVLNDGFASFPSGHSSFSSAGMIYLTLWLCARWSVVPLGIWNSLVGRASKNGGDGELQVASFQRTAPAPPVWMYMIAFSPLVLMAFICTSRYADFHHAGIDIMAGIAIGTFFAWFGFRLYHLPLGYGAISRVRSARSDEDAFLGPESIDEERGNDPVDHDHEMQSLESLARQNSWSSRGRIIPPETRRY